MNSRRILFGIFLAILTAGTWAWAQKPKTAPRRATPPKFDRVDPFYANAFELGLSGERPADLGKAVVASASPSSGGGNSPAAASGGGGGGSGAWNAIISSTALEDEIKAQKTGADKGITTATDFTSNGYKYVRREFSVAAMIFAIIAEYDGDVRWKKESAGLRDVFARTAANAKVATTGVYNESKVRKQELADLVGGQGVDAKADAEAKANWAQLCNRAPLMQRLEISFDEKLKKWTANKGDFTSNIDAMAHEAQVCAAIGTVLVKEGMEDGDNSDYAGFAKLLSEGALNLAKACKEKNYEAAEKAATMMAQSCDKCHEGFR